MRRVARNGIASGIRSRDDILYDRSIVSAFSLSLEKTVNPESAEFALA